jgi:hypothetical protein
VWLLGDTLRLVQDDHPEQADVRIMVNAFDAAHSRQNILGDRQAF